MNNNKPLTQCISNGGQSAKYETNMDKTNSSANMKVSAKNSATTHTHNRCAVFERIVSKSNIFVSNRIKSILFRKFVV